MNVKGIEGYDVRQWLSDKKISFDVQKVLQETIFKLEN